ncbi:MAG: sigma 54-interacting transcriptional regulator [Desulfamplus sp.]|nr:sigma 54-interacting transcriptional regulator [Desulfamplus sp.]
MKNGAFDFLVKPLSMEQITLTASYLVKRYQGKTSLARGGSGRPGLVSGPSGGDSGRSGPGSGPSGGGSGRPGPGSGPSGGGSGRPGPGSGPSGGGSGRSGPGSGSSPGTSGPLREGMGRDQGESREPEGVEIITCDKSMQRILTLAKRVADSTASVLIQGESGTGKELVARLIHDNSRRRDMPFVAINCAALPENLLESELFGHEKGAFTGAVARKEGKFELAHRGTLFLDEITEMAYHLQAKLLRVLQEKVVDRLGGSEPIGVDVRIVATTNRDVKESIANGEFREDLYHRLNTIPLVLPPLRQRMGDLKLLCDYFIRKYSIIDARDVKGMTDEAFSLLSRQSFPGNVRELENIIHRAVLLAQEELIASGDLMMEDFLPMESGEGGPASLEQPRAEESPESLSSSGTAIPLTSLKEMEEQMIYSALDTTQGNRTHAAKILGITVRTLRNKLNEYKDKRG